MYRGLTQGLSRATARSPALPFGYADPDLTLDLDFTAGTLDPRIAVTRSGTATRINGSGVLETVAANTARIDFDPVTLARRGLLIEESRTNMALWSEDFSNVVWPRVRSGVTTDAGTAPDGTTTADKLTEQTDTATNRSITQNLSITSGTTYTISVFAKAVERSGINLRFASGFAAGNVTFDLTNGTVFAGGTVAASGVTQLANGWWRCWASYTATSTTTAGAQVFLATPGPGITYDGVAGNGALIWGAQVEVGAWASSYIPTTTATVTRAVDQVTVPVDTWFNPDAGTLFADFTPVGVGTGLQTAIYLDDGTNNERMGIRASVTANAFLVVDNNAVQAQTTIGTLTAGTDFRAAFAYQANNFGGAQNGNGVSTDPTGTVPTVTTLKIGHRLTSSEALNAHFRKARYYKARKSDADLVSLTA